MTQVIVGPIATVNKKASNKVPLPCPTKFGNTIHMNIGYGTGKVIGGITHTLFMVGKATCKKYVYSLKNLTSCLLKASKHFLCNIHITPIRMIAYFDEKLIKGKVEDYLSHFPKDPCLQSSVLLATSTPPTVLGI